MSDLHICSLGVSFTEYIQLLLACGEREKSELGLRLGLLIRLGAG